MRLLILTISITALASTASAQEHVGHDAHSAYAADTSWTIKALSPEDVAGLLEGRGMGLARAAELNSYPGPLHVLELADELELSPAQRDEIGQTREAMLSAAQTLGAQVVDMERRLDALFAEGHATTDSLDRMTAHLAELEGQLRAVHLRAHIVTRSSLTSEQVDHYNHLRGYTNH